MKFKKIVGFGDSWMFGDELLDPELQRRDPDAHPCLHENNTYRDSHNFLGLVAQHYGVPMENFGIAGGSMQSSMWTFLWWLDHEPEPEKCLILIGHTDSDRLMVKQQLVLTNCSELAKLNYQQTLLSFDGIAARRNLQMMQFQIMPEDVKLDLPTQIWPGFSTTIWFRDHPGNQQKELVKPGGHPNEIGHKMIADKLISTIDDVTM